ncbi:Transposon TX1 uncharacterized 149 kDa protein [Vitis vinifera]|uniref:Transposon TX1 uncharacterized 149 kDa protein n=1 Tax=Vitis vinifera TaxID=29760 RepID=A0A438JA13_VITVI|nr:Transposon TX1 uncharacterized 149 kDa protein [Vitis vinifera]
MRHRGLQDGPEAPQAHQTASASSLLPTSCFLCKGDHDALSRRCKGPPAFFGEEGRAVELKAQSLPTLGHVRHTVGWKKSKRGRGKPRGSPRDATQEEETTISKKTWSTLFPPSVDRRQGHRCSSEPIFTRGSSSSSEDRNMEEEFGMGFQMERGIRVNPLSRCPLSGNLSKEDTSASRVEVKGGLTGRVGFDPRGYSDMVSPSNSIIRGKGLIFEGFAKFREPKTWRYVSPLFSATRVTFFSFCSPDSPLKSLWSTSSQFSPSSSVSYGKSRHLKKFYEKGGVDYLKHGDIPDRVEEENQCALSNHDESCTPKESIVRSHKEDSGDFLIDGLSPGKMAKVREVLCSLDIKVYSGGRTEAPQVIETCWFWLGRSENPDVVMIQETKKENCDRRFVGSVWTVRNKDWVALPASGASGGILIIWDSKNLRREEVVIGSFSVSVKFSLDGCGPLWISAVYGPNSPSLRKDFWVELFDIYGLTYPLWCVGGDFNVIRRSSEKMGGSSLTPSMRDFDSFIRECELLDPPLRNASFTWSNMQESPVCKRLDRFLYSNEWGLLFPQGLQEALIRRTSDHWPIVMDTNPFMWGPTPFRFENMWLQHTNFKENFRDWWSGFQGNGWEGHKFMRRLQYVKAKLKEWNKFSFGELKEKKKSILNDLANFDAIEQEGGLNPDLLSQRASRKGELEELILREEIHWRQKAKVKWVKEGDCNSKFYHKVANGRRNRKYIKELENERGLVLKNAESITEEILHYFEKLYTNPTGESWGVEGLDWSPISEESALRLDSPFTEEEISKAIFQLDRDKAPGPDGFTIAVFQECWDVIKEDLSLQDNSQSALGRLRGVLHETIHYTQGAFVQGRQILDAVLIANEIVDERRRSGEEGVVFKIDFEKAYDHVKWDFLDHVLEKKGFSPRWRKWMSGCLSSVSYAILVNGSAKGMLMRAEERNMMEGFRVGRNRTRVSHLQFADDTIFFSNSREEELQTLKSLLLVFGHISGLKVNLNKSSIYGINLDQAHLSRLAVMLDCKASDGLFSIWVSLWAGILRRVVLGSSVERISSRLDGWQKAYLSFGGRITLIQSCHPFAKGWGRQKGSFSEVGCCVQTEDNRGFGFGEYFLEESRSSREMVMEMVTSLSLEGYCSSLSGVFFDYSNFPSKFVWNSQVPFKVKSFVWLVAHKKVNTNDMLQVRRPYKALSPDICFGNSKRGIVLWQAASIALIRVVWWERNARIFEDKARNSEFLWDSIVFLASLWAFCSKAFKGIPLNVIQLDWIAVCTP